MHVKFSQFCFILEIVDRSSVSKSYQVFSGDNYFQKFDFFFLNQFFIKYINLNLW